MSDETEMDPRFQEPLQPGWWKTADGWEAVLHSHRVDRRAKPVVIVMILLGFLALNHVTDWEMVTYFSVVALLLTVLVLVYSPLDVGDAGARRPLRPSPWGPTNANLDDPRVWVGRLFGAAGFSALILYLLGSRGLPFAVACFALLGRGVLPTRYRYLALPAAVAAFFFGFIRLA